MSTDIYQLARIPILKRAQGYYLRWWYNGWHYWQFYGGGLTLKTSGEDYRTYGERSISVSSGQISLAQANAIRTITNSTEVYIYTDSGWRLVRLITGTMNISNNFFNGFEIAFALTIGSRIISQTGYSPVTEIPVVPADPDLQCEVIIGSQIWACKNYDAAYPASRVYNDDEANRAIYGGLYRGTQVMNAGFAPEGWHVPTLAEWQTMIDYIGGISTAGQILKATGTNYWLTALGLDVYNFNARGGGYWDGTTGVYKELKSSAYFWTATPDGIRNRQAVSMVHGLDFALPVSKAVINSCSVRLLKDTPTPPSVISITTVKAGIFTVSLKGGGDVTIDWGDGAFSYDSLSPSAYVVFTHAYAAGGTLTITGNGFKVLKADSQQVTACVVPADCVTLETINLFNNSLTTFDTHAEWVQLRALNLGNNAITTFVAHNTWSSLMSDFSLFGSAVTSAAEINAILIAIDETGMTGGGFEAVDVSGGTNAAPTGAGITAANNLIARGVSVTTN